MHFLIFQWMIILWRTNTVLCCLYSVTFFLRMIQFLEKILYKICSSKNGQPLNTQKNYWVVLLLEMIFWGMSEVQRKNSSSLKAIENRCWMCSLKHAPRSFNDFQKEQILLLKDTLCNTQELKYHKPTCSTLLKSEQFNYQVGNNL